MRFEQLEKISHDVLQELRDATDGKKNSLAFLRNFIPTPFVKDDEVFQVIVVGGSICRNVLMRRNGHKYTILSHTEKEQPIYHTEHDFLSFLGLEIDTTVKHVALNFAFPHVSIERDGKIDGVLLYGTKEHTFEGLQGAKIGQRIEEYIHTTQKRSIDVCVANDTICLLLSGSIDYNWKELACAIVGTGYNAAFFLSSHEAVNLEAGGFNRLPSDAIEEHIDKTSSQPGMQLFEKRVSGGYLYRYFNKLLEEKGLAYPEIMSTKVLDDLARKRNEVGKHAQEVLEKSAQLVACQIAAIAMYRNSDLTCVVEGSVFWNGFNYRETVEKTLKELVPSYTITFVHIENSSVLGAAKLIA